MWNNSGSSYHLNRYFVSSFMFKPTLISPGEELKEFAFCLVPFVFCLLLRVLLRETPCNYPILLVKKTLSSPTS